MPGSKLDLALPLLLPDLADARDRCVSALIQTLSARSGILAAHVVDEAASPAELCIHYDSDLISLERVRELAESVGAEMTVTNILSAGKPSDRAAARQASTESHADDHAHEHEHGHGGPIGEQSEPAFALICGTLLATGWIVSRWTSGL